jgi:hypothetical protein
MPELDRDNTTMLGSDVRCWPGVWDYGMLTALAKLSADHREALILIVAE